MKHMKKQIMMLLAVLCLLFGTTTTNAQTPRIVDDAEILSESTEEKLTEKTAEIAKKYNFDVVFVTVDSTLEKTPEAFADDYFDEHGYLPDGVLFLVSIDDRKWHISTTGYGIKAFTDYGCGYIGDKVKEKLSDGDYNEAATVFVEECEAFLEEAEDGTPYDTNHQKKSFLSYVWSTGFVIAISLVIAFFMMRSMKKKMNTINRQESASNYVKNVNLTRKEDVFLRSAVTRTKINTGSGSRGGSSTHRSSSGRSHGGRGGSF